MKCVTPRQMNEIDNLTVNSIGVPGIVLMENAALQVVLEVLKYMGSIRGKKIFIFAGKGNNGGDAFAAARHLYNKGAVIKVFITAAKQDISGDAGKNLNILEKLGASMVELLETQQLCSIQEALNTADLIVDGIFGTGLKGEVTGLTAELIDIINASGKRILSIDIPSGVCGATGKILGTCIKAHKTVTFALPKVGLAVHPGSEAAGELIIADIGIPSSVIDNMAISLNITDENQICRLIPRRHSSSNKGDYGKILIITGSAGMTGAGCLSAAAALRTGAGLVYLGVPSTLVPIYDALLTESITLPLEDEGKGYLSAKCTGSIINRIKVMDAAVIGPGMSVNDDTLRIISGVVEACSVPLVLDADALNAISRDISLLKRLKVQGIVTPHPGEMARLLGISIQDVQNNRIEIAREFADKWGIVTVLKGARTVVAMPEGTIYVNPTGNSGMATGGTGDVLAGVIASLLGQGLKPGDAAVAGVYLHGLAGDDVAKIKGEHGLIAGDLVNQLPYTIKKIIDGSAEPGEN